MAKEKEDDTDPTPAVREIPPERVRDLLASPHNCGEPSQFSGPMHFDPNICRCGTRRALADLAVTTAGLGAPVFIVGDRPAQMRMCRVCQAPYLTKWKPGHG